MSTVVSWNGTSYTIPATGEENWGGSTKTDGLIIALAQHGFQKSGGTFALSTDVDFGGTAGLKSIYFKSRAAALPTTGVVRLGNAEIIAWRNNADNANLPLTVNSSDILTFNGNPLLYSSGALTASRAVVTDGSGVVTAATTTATEIGYVNGVTSAIQTQINSKITAGAGAIVDADVNASAAMARTKLASGTNNHVLINNGSGVMSSEAQLAITRGGTGQSTAIAAFDALSPATTKGDVITRDASNNIRVGVGSDGQVLTADSAQTAGIKWATPTSAPDQSYELSNLAITCSVGSNALTIALKTKGGSNASAGDPIKVGFRSSTASSGVYNQRSITGALSLTVSSGSTLGTSSGKADQLYVYLIDNSGTPELAICGIEQVIDEGGIVSTTAEGGAGAADSPYVLYSATARSNVPVRLIGRLTSTQATAGTWASAPSVVSLVSNFPTKVRARYKNSGGNISTSVAIFDFDTKDFDTHNAVTTGGSWAFTAPVAGYYNVSSKVVTSLISGVSVGVELLLFLYKNGVHYTTLGYGTYVAASGNSRVSAVGSSQVYLAQGDTMDMRMQWTAGGATTAVSDTMQNWVDIFKV